MGQKQRRRNAFKRTNGLGFFAGNDQRASLSKLGDPLERLNACIDWETFREPLAVVYGREDKVAVGRPPIDAVLMLRILILQRLYNLSDDQTEYQIRDRASFQRFLDLHVEDGSPDAKTIWKFRERIKDANLERDLFFRFDAHLRAQGLTAKGGQIIDATIIEAPRQRNTRGENEQIKEGEMPAEWDDQRNKIAQKDCDARWTKKHGQTYFGYKNHINVDAEHKLIRDYTVTDAAVHDSQVFDDLVEMEPGERAVYADSAYRSEQCEAMLAAANVPSRIHERAYTNAPLSEAQKAANREKSRVRVRVEHVFGFVRTSMNGGGVVRTIGSMRAQVVIALSNLTYNLARFAQIVLPRRRPAAA